MLYEGYCWKYQIRLVSCESLNAWAEKDISSFSERHTYVLPLTRWKDSITKYYTRCEYAKIL